MIALALECSTESLGVALLNEDRIEADLYLGPGRHHAAVLLPALEKMLLLAGIPMEQIDLLCCTTGPGSFTGVRIGVSTAKGLAMATGKPVVGISTLAALAMNAISSSGLIGVLLDARRDQVYAGVYQKGLDGFPEVVMPDRLTEIARLTHDLPTDDVEWIGNGALRYRKQLLESGIGRCDPAGSMRHRLLASAVGQLGIQRYCQGHTDDPLTMTPIYLRLSEAEVRSHHP